MKKYLCTVTAVLMGFSAVALGACAKPGDNTEGSEFTGLNLDALVGKTVGVAQLANVPGLTLQVVLNKHDIDYQIIGSVQAEKASDKVNLVAFEASNITPVSGCDYYLCPEPVATAKVNATKDKPASFEMVGDLQALYGGEDGYPQAILVAKKEIAGDTVTGSLTSVIGNSYQYLANACASNKFQNILPLLDSVRTEGLTPAFDANNFNETVVANCSVKYTPSRDCKEKVINFLDELIEVNGNSASKVSDDFFYTGDFTAQATEGVRTVYAPDGAPALALVEALDRNLSGYKFEVINASTVQAKVTGENPVADYCILPVNLASKLLGSGSVYQMLGTVTNGNLYFLTVKNA